MSEKSGWTVDPLIMEVLKFVWRQQEEAEQTTRALAVAERLSEKTHTIRWEVRDKRTNTVLKVFSTEESMEPFLPRLNYQHGALKIKKIVVRVPGRRSSLR